MLDTVYHNVEDKKATLLLALDLSMAFDSIDIDTLVYAASSSLLVFLV